MKYFLQYKDSDQIAEIPKSEAKRHLEGCWKQDWLDDIFENDICFRLYTPYVDVWTEDDQGRVPIAGFYGIVG